MDELTIKVDDKEYTYKSLQNEIEAKIDDETKYEGKTKKEYADYCYFYLASKLSEERVKIKKDIHHFNDDDNTKWEKAERYREEAWKLIDIGYKENPDKWEDLYFKNLSWETAPNKIDFDINNKKSLSIFMFYAYEYPTTNPGLRKCLLHPKVQRIFLKKYSQDWGMLLKFSKIFPYDTDFLDEKVRNNPEFLWFVIENIQKPWHSLPDTPEDK